MKKIRLKLVEGGFPNPVKQPITTARDVFLVFRSLKDRASETLVAVYLQADMTGIYDIHATGGMGQVPVYTEDLFGRAYATRARYLILMHNHPGGDPTPSREGWATIAELEAYAAPMQRLQLLDFIIVGDDHYWSWYEEEKGGDYDVEHFAA